MSDYYKWLRKEKKMHKRDAVGKAKGDAKLAASGQKRQRNQQNKALLPKGKAK
jgi:hypothetical protein